MIEIGEETKEITQEKNQSLPLSLRSLERLSWNYWWSWSADGPSVFRDLDPEVWEEYDNNPRLLLAKVSDYRLAQMGTDPAYIDRVRRLADEFDRYQQSMERSSP